MCGGGPQLLNQKHTIPETHPEFTTLNPANPLIQQKPICRERQTNGHNAPENHYVNPNPPELPFVPLQIVFFDAHEIHWGELKNKKGDN